MERVATICGGASNTRKEEAWLKLFRQRRKAVTHAVGQAAKSLDGASKSGGPLSGARGIAAGAGAAALVPLAAKGVGKLVGRLDGKVVEGVKAPGKALEGVTSKLGSTVGGTIEDKLTDKIEESGGAGGILKEGLKSALPFGGGSGGRGKGGMPGVGKGRRMPVQQSVDVAVPIETVYNQWTQFEQWPEFMHRVTRVTQEDDCTVSFATKIWAKTKEFTAEIETQRPNERIKWRVTNGITHTGVVTFHELAPRLTRIELGLGDRGRGGRRAARFGLRRQARLCRSRGGSRRR